MADKKNLAAVLEEKLKELEQRDVWVPGIANGANDAVLRLMAKHGLLSPKALELFGLDK